MFNLLYTYQWIFLIIVALNFLTFMYVLYPRFQKGKVNDGFSKFLFFLVLLLSIISFLYGIYLFFALIPNIGESIKGSIYSIIIPILIMVFNGGLIAGTYPICKDFLNIK